MQIIRRNLRLQEREGLREVYFGKYEGEIDSMISYREGEFKVQSVNDNSYSEKGRVISRKNCD